MYKFILFLYELAVPNPGLHLYGLLASYVIKNISALAICSQAFQTHAENKETAALPCNRFFAYIRNIYLT